MSILKSLRFRLFCIFGIFVHGFQRIRKNYWKCIGSTLGKFSAFSKPWGKYTEETFVVGRITGIGVYHAWKVQFQYSTKIFNIKG